MKSVIRASMAALAALTLLSTTAWAQGGSRYPGIRYRMTGEARVARAQNTAPAEPELAPAATPESITAPEPIADPDASTDGPSLGEYDGQWGDEESFDVGSCGGGVCPPGLLFRTGKWYGTLDYLLVRTRLSQGTALVSRTTSFDDSGTPVISTVTDTATEFPFKYQSAFRASLGYRLLDCGGDFQVTYWRLQGNATTAAGPADVEAINPVIIGNVSIKTETTGDTLTASTGVTANLFDVDFAKCLSLGGPSNSCDCSCCPRWDLRWAAGARIADISRYNNNFVTNIDGDRTEFGTVNARFVGAGPRVGVQGRRFFGPCGNFALFARASQALLIGDYRISRVSSKLDLVPDTNLTTIVTDKYARLVPVTDIEVGGTWQVAPYAFLSAGYFFQCWWDLGQSETINTASFGSLDSANILGFDGLFVRGELFF